MSKVLLEAVTALAERLVTLAGHDNGLRDDLRALAEAILVTTERPVRLPEAAPEVELPEDGEHSEPGAELPIAVAVPPVGVTTPDVVPAAPPLPELTLGRARPQEPVHSPEAAFRGLIARAATTDADLPVIGACCRLKAEGVRWAVTRRRRISEGADFRAEIAPRDNDILDRAGQIGCYLWMNTPDFSVPMEPVALEDVAGWFDALADAIDLVQGMLPDVDANREFFEPALDLLAEAQSALRTAIDQIGGPNDADQFRVYDWLRGVAAREQIYIRRHMRLDDPANTGLLAGFERRVEELDAKLQAVKDREKKRKSVLSRLRYHAKLIGEGTGGEHDWRKVAGAIDELVDEGVAPSAVVIREIMLPILDGLPDLENLPPGFRLVLRDVDRYLAARTPAGEMIAADLPTAEVSEAARLLKGKGVILIGGNRRPDAYEALKAAFGLKELIWIETREHESIDKFEPYVARPDIALVLLAIRWSSHSFGDLKQFCDRHGKPMVRLPGGYGVNQVAAQIIAQCSEKLGAG